MLFRVSQGTNKHMNCGFSVAAVTVTEINFISKQLALYQNQMKY